MKESEIINQVKIQFKEAYKERFEKTEGKYIISAFKISMLSSSARNYNSRLNFSNAQLKPLVASGYLICQLNQSKSYYPCGDFFTEIEREALIEMNIPLSHPIELMIKKEEKFINDYSSRIDKAKLRRKVYKQKLQEVSI